jgi:AcrR family transcriptional regulator
VETAARLVRERGDSKFTTEELAAAADIGQASLFYYFKGGRQEIETALALRDNWELLERVAAAGRDAGDGTASLVSLVRVMQSWFEEAPEARFDVFLTMMKGPWPQELLAEHVEVINRSYDAIEAKLVADREAGRLHSSITDVRRYIMLTFSLAVGQIAQASMIEASGGDSIHARTALFDDLVALIERGTRA